MRLLPALRWRQAIPAGFDQINIVPGGWTVGVLVQSNFGGILQIMGAPVGRELGRYMYRRFVEPERDTGGDDPGDGSIMIVVATDAPLSSRNLERLAKRALLGIPRTGGFYSNGSGDFCIAFSAAEGLRIPYRSRESTRQIEVLRNSMTSALFLAAAEASEEAILNSLFKATDMVGRGGRRVEALPLDKVREIMKEKE